ncbi:MAG: hypothetical protein RL297_1150 [Pseudomonadota bacterium]|jgi:hypothetical protein
MHPIQTPCDASLDALPTANAGLERLMSLNLSPLQPLAAAHLLGDFECGEPALDEWLKHRRSRFAGSCAARTSQSVL